MSDAYMSDDDTHPANMITLEKDGQLPGLLEKAGPKLVVMKFFATWCSHCKEMAPVFIKMASKYQMAVFIEINIETCEKTTKDYKISCLPSFVFFRNSRKLSSFCGSEPKVLEDKIKQFYGTGEGDTKTVTNTTKKNLVEMIDMKKCVCLNESKQHPLKDALSPLQGYLESDSGPQMVFTVVFTNHVNLQSIIVDGPEENGPKTIKMFVNQAKNPDFVLAQSMYHLETVQLTKDDLKKDVAVNLLNAKFKDIHSITMYIKDNQTGTSTTRIDHVGFVGHVL